MFLAEAYSEPCQTSKTEFLTDSDFNGWKLVTIFVKGSILDV